MLDVRDGVCSYEGSSREPTVTVQLRILIVVVVTQSYTHK